MFGPGIFLKKGLRTVRIVLAKRVGARMLYGFALKCRSKPESAGFSLAGRVG